MPTDIDYMEMVLRKAGFDVDGDCVWQRIKKELVDGQKTTTNSAMVPLLLECRAQLCKLQGHGNLTSRIDVALSQQHQ